MDLHVFRKLALVIALLLALSPAGSFFAYANDYEDFTTELLEDLDLDLDLDYSVDVPEISIDTDINCWLEVKADGEVKLEKSQYQLMIASSVADLLDEALADSEYQDSVSFDEQNTEIRVNDEEIGIDPDCYILEDGDEVEVIVLPAEATDSEDEFEFEEIVIDEIPEIVMATQAEIDSALSAASSTLAAAGEKDKWTLGYEFDLLTLARDDNAKDSYVDKYYKAVKNKLESNKSDKLKETMSSDNSKAVLALTSLGIDPTDVGGYNLLQPLSDKTYITKQGINGPVWALLAFDSHNYEIPTCSKPENQVTRELIVAMLSAAQHSDGGWSYSGSSDVDMTAMVIQALTPYYGKAGFEDATAAVNKALDWLAFKQNDKGGFSSGGVETSESSSQVIIALSGLGIDLDTDARFIKNGKTVIDGLLTFKTKGGFKHIYTETSKNGLGTTQGCTALVAYQRAKDGKSGIYDMNDVPELVKKESGSVDPGQKEEDPGKDDSDKDKEDEESQGGEKATGKTKSLGTLTLGEDENSGKEDLGKKAISAMRTNHLIKDSDELQNEETGMGAVLDDIPDVTMWIIIGLAALLALAAMIVARLRSRE